MIIKISKLLVSEGYNSMDIGVRAKRLIEIIKHDISNENHDANETTEIIVEGKELIDLLCEECKKTKKQASIMRKRLRHAQNKHAIGGHDNKPG